jgi:UDP-glucose 4-epimerase|tara:strand:+ start:3771 stop:4661 length:891 start_codon:yes stop_codon:yes gene_type:complete
MNALVTGVSGFIAPHIVEACLNKGWKTIGVDIRDCDISHPDFQFWKKDVRELRFNDMKDIDYVFHLAFVTNIPNSVDHPLETTRDNINMTAYFLDLSTKAEVKKFIYPSTASLYGDTPPPWSESVSSPDPIEPYSWQKLTCEYACSMWYKRYGLPTVVFRLFQVFGENQRPDTALAAFMLSKKEGKPITLTKTTAQSSFKSAQRDFIYVKDIAQAFILAAESKNVGNGETINIGTGKVYSIEEVANVIGGEITWIPRRGYEVERHEADITKAKKLLNWSPKVDIIDWLNEFITSME